MEQVILSKYNKGFDKYEIQILRVHLGNTIWDHSKSREINLITPHRNTTYYTKFDNKLWFLEDYQIDSLIKERQIECRLILQIIRSLIIKLMLDKKYEG